MGVQCLLPRLQVGPVFQHCDLVSRNPPPGDEALERMGDDDDVGGPLVEVLLQPLGLCGGRGRAGGQGDGGEC